MLLSEAKLLLGAVEDCREIANQILESNSSDRTISERVHILIGRGYIVKENYEEAKFHFLHAITYFDGLHDLFALARCLSSLGVVQMKQAQSEEARIKLQKAQQIQSRLGDNYGIIVTQHNSAPSTIVNQSFLQLLRDNKPYRY